MRVRVCGGAVVVGGGAVVVLAPTRFVLGHMPAGRQLVHHLVKVRVRVRVRVRASGEWQGWVAVVLLEDAARRLGLHPD